MRSFLSWALSPVYSLAEYIPLSALTALYVFDRIGTLAFLAGCAVVIGGTSAARRALAS